MVSLSVFPQGRAFKKTNIDPASVMLTVMGPTCPSTDEKPNHRAIGFETLDGHSMPIRAGACLIKRSQTLKTSTRHGVTGIAQRGILANMFLNAVIERDLQTGLLVGSVPGIPGAHTQGESVEEVRANLVEVIELLQAQNALTPESEFIGTTTLMVS